MPKPDYIYNPDDWECTYSYDDRSTATEELSVGDVLRFGTLHKGPDTFAAHVVISRDDAGDPDETEIRWFATEAEARAACGMPPHITAG